MQKAIFEEVVRLIDKREPFALATVVKASGSTPGKDGFRMIVYPDGRQLGTVGGAGLEKQVAAKALECIKSQTGGLFSFNLWYKNPEGLDALCGGTEDVYIEFIKPKPHILICGGGHVGYAVARLCEETEYFYSVLDDRAEYSSPTRFPTAYACHNELPEQFFKHADLKSYSHIVVLGYSHKIDTEILKNIVGKFDGYIGVIASEAKKKEQFQRLKDAGISVEYLAKIECPIGIDIGAKTPAEIAVSILASIINSLKK